MSIYAARLRVTHARVCKFHSPHAFDLTNNTTLPTKAMPTSTATPEAAITTSTTKPKPELKPGSYPIPDLVQDCISAFDAALFHFAATGQSIYSEDADDLKEHSSHCNLWAITTEFNSFTPCVDKVIVKDLIDIRCRCEDIEDILSGRWFDYGKADDFVWENRGGESDKSDESEEPRLGDLVAELVASIRDDIETLQILSG
jgi:hypothetical protein